MKFSHSVQFNAVPDWSGHYIAYSNLKKLIYQLEKTVNHSLARPDHLIGNLNHDPEDSPLLSSDENPDAIFRRALDQELDKIENFYKTKESEIFGELKDLLEDKESFMTNSGGIDFESQLQDDNANDSNRHRRGSILGRFSIGAKKRRPSNVSAASTVDEEDDDSDEDQPRSRWKENDNGRGSQRKRSNPYGQTSLDELRKSPELQKKRRKTSFAVEDYADQAMDNIIASGVSLKKRTISLYVTLCELKSFIQLNKTGFSKVCKKYDKILDRSLKHAYLHDSVAKAYIFQQSTMTRMDENIYSVEEAYADVIVKGDVQLARKELRLHLREHVVWERNTVWREMIGIERKAQAANLGIRRTLLGGEHRDNGSRLQGDNLDDSHAKEVVTPVGRYRCPRWLFSSTLFTLIIILAVFVVLLVVPIMAKPEQQNCLAMLIFVSLLWATEVIPLFVTALLIPFLAVVLRVVRDDQAPHNRLAAPEAAKYVLASMWTPVIMLLLGGFTIAAALSKFHIAKILATFVLSKAGTRPRTVLLTNMFVAMILSMWISNVASPVLCYSIIQPLLRNLPPDSPFSKALILGIALAANIGGAASPIASPQNIIALQNMDPQPSWGVWFIVALPVCISSILVIWLLLYFVFLARTRQSITIIPIRPTKDTFTPIQYFISFTTIITIILWCLSHSLTPIFGDMGIIALIPIALFFGTGILTKEDFNNFLWTIIILAAGGLSLGHAVSSSGLLHEIAGTITSEVKGMGTYSVLLVFCSLAIVVATFISHTVAALIILPLVASVGQGMMEGKHANLLVMSSALVCSAAMGLPTSGFPNMTAIMLESPQTGHRYLRVRDFLTSGIMASLICWAIIVSLGWALLLLVGL